MARFLLGLLLLASSPPASAQDKVEVRGFVKEIDAKVGTITVDIPKSGVQTYSLVRADLPVVNARDKALKLDQLKPKQKIGLNIVSDADVASIRVFPSFKVGRVVSVNEQTREVELLVKKETLKFKIAKDAQYWRSERVVMPRELKMGHQVKLYYLPDSGEVIEIIYRQLDAGS